MRTPRPHNAGFALMLIAAALLAGCRYYYTKPGATDATFAADHAACVQEVGKFSTDRTRAYVATGDYRGCMQLRGWIREERADTATVGWYRGIEEDGVYDADTPPPRRESLESTTQMREHCRQLHLMGSDWRQRLDKYNACLGDRR